MHLSRVLSASAVILCAITIVHARPPAAHVVHVADVESLYDAVDDPDNAGAQIVLAPGRYVLSPLDPTSTSRLDLGRLELQHGMALSGQPGHPEAVVIDAAGLPAASYVTPQGGAGAVRVGRGDNTIEWLTVLNATAGQAGIDTGLVAAPIARVRLAHLILAGHVRGFDIRNFASAAGRVLRVDLEDNDLSFNQINMGFGIRVANAGATGAAIEATLRGNDLHDNLVGLLAANLNSIDSTIAIESHADHFDRNRVGAVLIGGNSTLPNAQASGNGLSFNAHGSTFRDNAGVFPITGDTGGLVLVGGVATLADRASDNTLRVGLWGTRLSGNQDADIRAWGARTVAGAPAGTNNRVDVTLNGVSRQATDTQVSSAPAEPGGTNTVTIVR